MISVILPTYNERENAVKLSKSILKICKDCEIIIVDDNSPDGTAENFKANFYKDKKARMIERKNERGLATAIKDGIKNSKGDIIILMDVDFSHDPQTIPLMIKEIKENDYDIVLGSRYISNARLKSKIHRRITTWMMETFIQTVLKLGIKDITNGYIAVKKDLLKQLNFDKIFYGYGDYAIRLLFYSKKKGAKIKEVPSNYRYRTSGQTKTKLLRMGLQYGLAVLKLRFGINI